MSTHKFSGGFIKKENSYTMRIVFESEENITLENIKEITAIRQELFGDTPYCSLVDVRKDFMTWDKEALEYIAKNPKINRHRVAEALLVKNFGQKLGIDLYIRLFKPKRASKTFFKEQRAKKWLKKEYDKLIDTKI